MRKILLAAVLVTAAFGVGGSLVACSSGGSYSSPGYYAPAPTPSTGYSGGYAAPPSQSWNATTAPSTGAPTYTTPSPTYATPPSYTTPAPYATPAPRYTAPAPSAPPPAPSYGAACGGAGGCGGG